MRILLVEDDDTVADAIVRMMASHEFEVDHVKNVSQAYAIFNSNNCDLAIVDIGLPDCDGTVFVRRIRKEGSRMPVLMLTARHGLSERLKAFELGVDDYVMKPFDL